MDVKSFNIDKLLEPYKKGGLRHSPITRTLGTITSKLLICYRFSPEVVGVAVYKVFYKMAYEGLEFKGDGSYGSKGAELFSCIKAQCVDITEKKSVSNTIKVITKITACSRKCRYRTVKLKKQTKWVKFKNFWGEPRESLAYCLFWIISISSIGILTWHYIVELTL
jgi:hypothetical protein